MVGAARQCKQRLQLCCDSESESWRATELRAVGQAQNRSSIGMVNEEAPATLVVEGKEREMPVSRVGCDCQPQDWLLAQMAIVCSDSAPMVGLRAA